MARYLGRLSNLQKEVLRLISIGFTPCEIIEDLHINKQMYQDCYNAIHSYRNVEILLYTDTKYDKAVNVDVVDFSSNEWNVVVENVSVKTDEKNTVIKAMVTSYNSDTTLAVGLRLDGYVEKAQYIDLQSNIPKEVEFTINSDMKYDSLEVFTKVEDGLSADNSYSVCKKRTKSYNVYLASKSPLYLESVLNALGNCKVTTVGQVEPSKLNGYDLYIFDGIVPEQYPEDGSVILVGTERLPEGVYVSETVDAKTELHISTKASEEVYEDIIDGISLNEAVVSKYSKLNHNLRWSTVLECDGAPVCVTKNLEDGKKFTVLSFDLHNSNLPLLVDYILLVRNLVEYSVPALVKGDDYAIGEKVKLTVMPYAKELYIELPDGQVRQLSTTEDVVTISPTELGVYTAVITTDESGEYADFFVHIPNGETGIVEPMNIEANIQVVEDASIEDEAFAELWYYLAIILLILLLVEWGCYYYEQY
jgi:hypothetical protein